MLARPALALATLALAASGAALAQDFSAIEHTTVVVSKYACYYVSPGGLVLERFIMDRKNRPDNGIEYKIGETRTSTRIVDPEVNWKCRDTTTAELKGNVLTLRGNSTDCTEPGLNGPIITRKIEYRGTSCRYESRGAQPCKLFPGNQLANCHRL
jgi:hypothetical protein